MGKAKDIVKKTLELHDYNWLTPVYFTPCKSPKYFMFSLLCCQMASYDLRKRVLGEKWEEEYACCAGYGRFMNLKEHKCPRVCLALETILCFGTSVITTRWAIQERYKSSNRKLEELTTATAAAGTYATATVAMAGISGPVISSLRWASDGAWCCLCACAQTQHHIELNEIEQIEEKIRTSAPLHLTMC